MARADDGHTTVLRSGKPRGGGEGPVLERSGRLADEDPMVQAAAEEHQGLEIQDRWGFPVAEKASPRTRGDGKAPRTKKTRRSRGTRRTYTQQDIDDLMHEWESENEALKQLRQIYPQGAHYARAWRSIGSTGIRKVDCGPTAKAAGAALILSEAIIGKSESKGPKALACLGETGRGMAAQAGGSEAIARVCEGWGSERASSVGGDST